MGRVVIIDGDVERRAEISMALRGIGCEVEEVSDVVAGLSEANLSSGCAAGAIPVVKIAERPERGESARSAERPDAWLGAEATSEERDWKLNMAIEAGNVGLWDWDLVSNRAWFSPEWKRQIGYLDHEIQGTYEEWRSRLHPDDVDRVLLTLKECLEGTSGRYENEFRFFHKNGSYRWILARGALVKSPDGRPIRILGAHLDISERKYVEEALRHGEERYRRLFDANPLPMWLYDMETLRFIAVNEAAVTHYGYSREEFLGMQILDIRPPGEVPRLLEKLRQTPTGFDQAGVWKHRKKDGTLIDVDVSAHSVMLGGRKTELVLANDITRRRQAEQRVRQLNRIYAVLSDINKLIVREREAQVILEGACRIAVERGGFRMAWIGRLDPLTQQVHPVASSGGAEGYLEQLDINLSDPQRCTGPVGKSILGGRHEITNDLETDGGFARWRDLALSKGFRSAAAFVLGTAPGRMPVGILCLYSGTRDFFDAEEVQLLDELAADISFALEGCEREQERKRVERAMRDSEERFRQLTETIDDVLWMVDPRTQEVIYVSPAYERIWGRSCYELRSSPKAWLEAVHPEDKSRVTGVQFSGKARDFRNDEYRIVRPDGQVRWIRDRAFPVLGPGNEVTRVVGVARDVTDLRQLEEQLRQSQKLEAIGQLAGGVAHDFNNILAAILMQVELAGLTPGLSRDLSESLEEIRLSAERAVALTRQLLLFGRKQVMQPRRVDLNGIVENLARMLQRIIGEDIRLQLHLDSQPVMASADAGMMDQILLNLAVNSRDAMPRGGRLSIETRRFRVTEDHVRRHPDAKAGMCARLSMVDTGCGISTEVLPHIFEPFFTTKDPGRGTGLGLATVFGIVKQHQGWIEVESTQGSGARFDVYLPLVEGGSGVEPGGAVLKVAARGNGETILLVEDDASVRLSTKALLERQGYRVLEAASGLEALEMWGRHRDEIGLLVTDLVMPGGVSGQELARRLRPHGGALKAIFTSGYSADIAGRELKLSPGDFFLQKPFPPELLLDRVRTCFG